ncbi:hypothetical protein Tco_0479289 [Tanacetum coccineum]
MSAQNVDTSFQYGVSTTMDTRIDYPAQEVLNVNEESGGMQIIWNLMRVFMPISPLLLYYIMDEWELVVMGRPTSFSGGDVYLCQAYDRMLVTTEQLSKLLNIGTDNQEKDEKQSQNDKTGLGMEKTVKDKAKSKPESQSSQKVNRKVNWSKSKSTQVNPGAKVQEI